VKFRATINLAGKTATGIQIPSEVVEALGAAKKPPVRVTIDGLSYVRRQEFVRGIEEAKRPETRQRRIAKAVGTLREDKTQG